MNARDGNFSVARLLLIIIFLSRLKTILATTKEIEVSVQLQSDGGRTNILGLKWKDWKGGDFYAFRGIPYAEPPIGDLRFQDPKPLSTLPETVNAHYDGHDCPHENAVNASEDCLTLNVYSKNIIASPSLLPVLVYIHYGGLYLSSGLSTAVGPQYLLSKSLVLVTFNYRLGPLGFLNLGTKEIPGNAGFKDQVLAMRWVQKNIQSFGGNPRDVTLIGYSAGALSVALHLNSPMSNGLFHKAIVMSGSLPPQTQMPVYHQRQLAKKQARVLGCKIKESIPEIEENEKILSCLNRFDGMRIAGTLRKMFEFGRDNPIFLWLPIIEQDFGQERFMIADYYGSLKNSPNIGMPLLFGFTDGELCASAKQIIENESHEKEFYDDFKRLAPKIFAYEHHPREESITEQIKSHYLQGSTPGHSDFNRLCDLFSDAFLRFGSHRLAHFMSNHKNATVAYKFTFKGELTSLPHARVEHTDDLIYLMRIPPLTLTKEHKDAFMVDVYVDFIYDFMKNGRIAKVSSSFPTNYIEINNEMRVKRGFNFDEAAFWDQLIPTTGD